MPRPYGTGPYGTGRYSRDAAAVYLVGGATGITFDATARPNRTLSLAAATGIVFDAWTTGIHVTVQPEAASEIVFAVQAVGLLSWTGWAPCETGGWRTPGPCEGGAWQAPGACTVGTWAEARLT
jgi:hypothetical protein